MSFGSVEDQSFNNVIYNEILFDHILFLASLSSS